jgi:hypothetical protein
MNIGTAIPTPGTIRARPWTIAATMAMPRSMRPRVLDGKKR